MSRTLFTMMAVVVAALLSGCTPAQPPSQPPTLSSPAYKSCPIGTVEMQGETERACLPEKEAARIRVDRAAQQQKVIDNQKPPASRMMEGLSAERREYEDRLSAWVSLRFPEAKDPHLFKFDYFCAQVADRQLAASGVIGRWPYVVNSSDGTVRVEGYVSERAIAALSDECSPRPMSGG